MRRALVAPALLAVVWITLCTQGERFLNRRADVPLPPVTPRARALHDASFVLDLHADSLLLRRDLLSRSSVGHVDLPRLREGGVAFQVLSLPTVTPWNMNFEATDGDAFDALILAGILQWTPFAWERPFGRSLWVADKAHAFAAASEGGLVIVESRADLAQLERRRARGEPVVGALLALEGAHAAEAEPENLERLFEAGYRMLGLTHFFDNDYAGSAHGLEKHGLTPLGRETVRRMEGLGMAVDLAHLAPAAIDDVLAIASKPLVVSHGGVKGTCPGPRTLSDAHVRAIAATGGVVGIGYFEGAVCGSEPRHVAEAILYVAELAGDTHVALGSDYDGATRVGFDTSELRVVTQALLDAGLSDDAVRRVLGDNALRVLRETLPSPRGP
jgi:microsomal dipeptidase-like Zn-dependent dipeptidase